MFYKMAQFQGHKDDDRRFTGIDSRNHSHFQIKQFPPFPRANCAPATLVCVIFGTKKTLFDFLFRLNGHCNSKDLSHYFGLENEFKI